MTRPYNERRNQKIMVMIERRSQKRVAIILHLTYSNVRKIISRMRHGQIFQVKQVVLLLALAGVIDPACTLEKICTPGYTRTVRPPASYTNKLKREQMAALGLTGDPSQYEEDHIQTLELCGSPRDRKNLIPELWEKARKKDVIESRLHRAVCAGKMKLEEAQRKVVAYE